MDLVLVNQFVGGIDGRVRRALAVFDDRNNLLAENATFGVPFLDSQQGGITSHDTESGNGARQRGQNTNLERVAAALAAGHKRSGQNEGCDQDSETNYLECAHVLNSSKIGFSLIPSFPTLPKEKNW